MRYQEKVDFIRPLMNSIAQNAIPSILTVDISAVRVYASQCHQYTQHCTGGEMAKRSTEQVTGQTWLYPSSIDKTTFQYYVSYLFLHQIRVLAWVMGGQEDWSILKSSLNANSLAIWDEQIAAQELPSFRDIEKTSFANCLQAMYDLAYHGEMDKSQVEPMEHETRYTWVALIVKDLRTSAVAHQWTSMNGMVEEYAEEVWKVIELAQARLNLEGMRGFLDVDGDFERTQTLTVRQLAILADMEEMSIRSAASRKGPNAPPVAAGVEGTRFHFAEAQNWIKAKGTYIPITRKSAKGEMDLARAGFLTISDLISFLWAREEHLWMQEGKKNRPDVTHILKKHGVPIQKEDFEEMGMYLLAPGLLSEIAAYLKLPHDLFSLRVRQTVARAESSSVDRQLLAMTKGVKP
ncbi:hypothetical protein [Noviherbaspirillum galbum]|uniref:Uncharacterized protein n=1 Tax=Noviherbaspirillum galbum TaxID=2709383 RepID=A0A6B3SR60_9BURK|nr:hypothetical protein [Noviherbaspirillum galbum]NEX60149.1 hypothetical protein [Noviherbaspirillum galbum]